MLFGFAPPTSKTRRPGGSAAALGIGASKDARLGRQRRVGRSVTLRYGKGLGMNAIGLEFLRFSGARLQGVRLARAHVLSAGGGPAEI